MQVVVYGIPNCDSIKKARNWFQANSVDYTFVDVRQNPPTREQLGHWMDCVGPKVLINKRSTTWKNMTTEEQQQTECGDTLSVLLKHPTLIKRPVLEHTGEVFVGFNADTYARRFKD